jgi:hypothetical protein
MENVTSMLASTLYLLAQAANQREAPTTPPSRPVKVRLPVYHEQDSARRPGLIGQNFEHLRLPTCLLIHLSGSNHPVLDESSERRTSAGGRLVDIPLLRLGEREQQRLLHGGPVDRKISAERDLLARLQCDSLNVLCGIAKLEAELEHVSLEVVDILRVEIREGRTSKRPEPLRPVDPDFKRCEAGKGEVELRDLFGQGVHTLVVVLVDKSSRDVESEVPQLLEGEHRIDRWEFASVEAIDMHAASVGAYKHVQSGCGELDREAERLDDGVAAHLVLPVGDSLATIFVVFELLFHPFEGMVVVVESALGGREGIRRGRGGVVFAHEVVLGNGVEELFGDLVKKITAGDGHRGGNQNSSRRCHGYSLACGEMLELLQGVEEFAHTYHSLNGLVEGFKHGPLCTCVPRAERSDRLEKWINMSSSPDMSNGSLISDLANISSASMNH